MCSDSRQAARKLAWSHTARARDVRILTNLIKVEWEVPGDGAIETRLQEGRPPVTETMRSAPVVFTDSRHARVDGLQTRKLRLVNFTVERARRENFISHPLSHFPCLPKCVAGEERDERMNEEI